MNTRSLLFIAISLVLTYSYLYPGSQAWLENRADTVMSDGTDITPVPYLWDVLKHTWAEHPSRFLFGSVWSDSGDPDRGYPVWVSWIERPVGLAMAYAGSVEQTSTGIVVVLLLLSAACMYALGRYLKWEAWVAFGLAVAWAFCAYTRARAQVHPGFVALYFIPLLFYALLLIVRENGWRSLFAAAMAILVAVLAPHYYVVTMAFLSPFFIAFVLVQPEARSGIKRVLVRLCIAGLPAILFLGFSLKFTVPPSAKVSSAAAVPQTGEAPPGQLHPFLTIYAARPVDYFTSDMGLSREFADINPLKTWLNESVYATMVADSKNGNPHERTNGVRWLIWLAAAAGLVFALRSPRERSNIQILYFAGLGLFAFLLSLAPDTLGYGPSAWLYNLVPQIRVSSRAGIWVHFSLLMIAGFWLTSQSAPARLRKWAALPFVLPALMVLEYPPFFQTVKMAPIAPAYASLKRENGACGVGMYFPLVNNNYGSLIYYRFLQRVRGSDCYHLNSLVDPNHLMYVMRMFPPAGEYLSSLNADMITPMRLQRLAKCVPLSFLAFDESVPAHLVQSYCTALGWSLSEAGLCMAPDKGRPMTSLPEQCGL